jgi:hypothetical protein
MHSPFSCPACAVKLQAQTTSSYIAAVIIWSLIEIPVRAWLHGLFPDILTYSIIFTLITSCIGFVIVSLIFSGFGYASFASNVDKSSEDQS